jgi:hypothetical protein
MANSLIPNGYHLQLTVSWGTKLGGSGRRPGWRPPQFHNLESQFAEIFGSLYGQRRIMDARTKVSTLLAEAAEAGGAAAELSTGDFMIKMMVSIVESSGSDDVLQVSVFIAEVGSRVISIFILF